MDRRKTFIGAAMVGLGIVQAGLYAIQSEWIPTGLALLFAGLGLAYLRTEVF